MVPVMVGVGVGVFVFVGGMAIKEPPVIEVAPETVIEPPLEVVIKFPLESVLKYWGVTLGLKPPTGRKTGLRVG